MTKIISGQCVSSEYEDSSQEKDYLTCSRYYRNVTKVHKPTNMNRKTPNFMGVPEQPSHVQSNKPMLN